MKALMLSPRNEAVSLPADRGRKMNAAEVADIIWEGKVSPKWVLKHMRAIGFKAGRDVLFFETEARTWSGNNSGYRLANRPDLLEELFAATFREVPQWR